jgi:hypothetical protein
MHQPPFCVQGTGVGLTGWPLGKPSGTDIEQARDFHHVRPHDVHAVKTPQHRLHFGGRHIRSEWSRLSGGLWRARLVRGAVVP